MFEGITVVHKKANRGDLIGKIHSSYSCTTKFLGRISTHERNTLQYVTGVCNLPSQMCSKQRSFVFQVCLFRWYKLERES